VGPRGENHGPKIRGRRRGLPRFLRRHLQVQYYNRKRNHKGEGNDEERREGVNRSLRAIKVMDRTDHSWGEGKMPLVGGAKEAPLKEMRKKAPNLRFWGGVREKRLSAVIGPVVDPV